jgi:hypothetical protein
MDELAARFILSCPEEEFSSFERLFFQVFAGSGAERPTPQALGGALAWRHPAIPHLPT